jgi:glutathione S-transferase
VFDHYERRHHCVRQSTRIEGHTADRRQLSVATDTVPMRSRNNAAEAIGAKEALLAFYDKSFREALENLDRRLGEADYLAGELSIADLAFYSMYKRRKALADLAPALGNLRRWGERLDARPGCQRGLAA